MRISLVHNPTAGDGQDIDEVVKLLTDAGHEVRHRSSKGDWKKLLQDPGDVVVAAGGDGTVRKVALAAADRELPFAALPIGTANNIAKSLGALGSVSELIAGWRRAERRRLAVGKVMTRWGSMRFVESVGVGVFTELVSRGNAEVNESSTGLTGHAIDRALLLLQRIVAERAPRFRRLALDGSDLSGEYLLVEVMNLPLVGPNIPLAPGADYGDGQLEIVTVIERERQALAEYVGARLSGGAAPPVLTTRRAARVTMRASPGELHVDDEAWRPEPPADEEAEEPGTAEGEVTIELEDTAVEILVGT